MTRNCEDTEQLLFFDKLINLSSNIAALFTFILNGYVLFPVLADAAFCLSGHYIGSGLVMKNGAKMVRRCRCCINFAVYKSDF
ncbi:MAG: hypothetical protein V8T31_08490 [Lachnospiraceae bacterium]